jgi:hypothetical protein
VNIVAELVSLFAEVLLKAIAAGDDKAKQEDALMTGEERIAALRAKAKFG